MYSNRYATAAALLALFLIAWVIASSRTDAQAPERIQPVTWEYKTHDTSGPPSSVELSRFGRNGWELVEIVPYANGSFRSVFTRRA